MDNIIKLGEYTLPYGVRWYYGVRNDKVYAYVSQGTKRFEVYDASDPSNIVKSGETAFPEPSAINYFYVPKTGNLIFLGYSVNNQNYVKIFDGSSPNAINEVGMITPKGSQGWIAMKDHIALILSNAGGKWYLEFYDVSTPQSPQKVLETEGVSNASMVSIFDDLITITAVDKGMTFIKIDWGTLKIEKVDESLIGLNIILEKLFEKKHIKDIKLNTKNNIAGGFFIIDYIEGLGKVSFGKYDYTEKPSYPTLSAKMGTEVAFHICSENLTDYYLGDYQYMLLPFDLMCDDVDKWLIRSIKLTIYKDLPIDSLFLKIKIDGVDRFILPNEKIDGRSDYTFNITEFLLPGKPISCFVYVHFIQNKIYCPLDKTITCNIEIKKENIDAIPNNPAYAQTGKIEFIDNEIARKGFIYCVENVTQNKYYNNIKSSLADAKDNDRIEICFGNYDEGEIEVNTYGLLITGKRDGEQPNIIAKEYNGFKINNDLVRIYFLAFKGKGSNHGIWLSDKKGIWINECKFFDFYNAIISFKNREPHFERNYFDRNSYGISDNESENAVIIKNNFGYTQIGNNSAVAIALYGSKNYGIENNKINFFIIPTTKTGEVYGIKALNTLTGTNWITNNQIKNCNFAIWSSNSYVDFKYNEIEGCFRGAEILNGHFILRINSFRNNITGISSWSKIGQLEIINNVIDKNNMGINLWNDFISGRCVIIGNYIRNNTIYGLKGWVAIDTNNYFIYNIYNNTFENNGKDIEKNFNIKKSIILDLSDEFHGSLILNNSPKVMYNNFLGDSLSAIITMNLANPIIANNNFKDCIDYAVQNLNDEKIINAKDNYWGEASGPSGAGPGTGEKVSANVDFSPFTSEKYNLVATCAIDTLFAKLGDSSAIGFYIRNWVKEDDIVSANVHDELGWIQNKGSYEITLNDTIGGTLDAIYKIPNNISEGIIDRVVFSAVSKSPNMSLASDTLFIYSYTPHVTKLIVTPDTLFIKVKDSTYLSGLVLDQFGGLTNSEIQWNVGGGQIIDNGKYIAGEAVGLFEAVATDKKSGISGKGYIKIVDTLTDIKENYLQINKKIIVSPNPAINTVRFTISNNNNGEVSISIYNLSGVLIERIFEGLMMEGSTEFLWGTNKVESGVYIYEAKFGNEREIGRIILFK